MTQTNHDILGFSLQFDRALLVNNLIDHYSYPALFDIKIRAYAERPVTVFSRTHPTLLEVIMKIGSLLGILSLVNFVFFYIHSKLFQRGLSKLVK